jgi:hypothetical protein
MAAEVIAFMFSEEAMQCKKAAAKESHTEVALACSSALQSQNFAFLG